MMLVSSYGDVHQAAVVDEAHVYLLATRLGLLHEMIPEKSGTAWKCELSVQLTFRQMGPLQVLQIRNANTLLVTTVVRGYIID